MIKLGKEELYKDNGSFNKAESIICFIVDVVITMTVTRWGWQNLQMLWVHTLKIQTIQS
jgi:hypothetical protein